METVDSRQVIGFAHRGARAHSPENTIDAFVTALRLGATSLETDVWLTVDGTVIIDHDGVVRRGGRKIPIRTLPRTSLPPHIPTLADLLDAVGTDLDLSIDIKDDDAAAEVIRVSASYGTEGCSHLWLCHPDADLLARWRTLDSEVHLVASIKRRKVRRPDVGGVEGLATRGIEALNMRGGTWTPGMIRRCHDAGLLAFAWNVQGKRRMQRLIGWGIDALYSDHSDRLAQVLGQTR